MHEELQTVKKKLFMTVVKDGEADYSGIYCSVCVCVGGDRHRGGAKARFVAWEPGLSQRMESVKRKQQELRGLC